MVIYMQKKCSKILQPSLLHSFRIVTPKLASRYKHSTLTHNYKLS